MRSDLEDLLLREVPRIRSLLESILECGRRLEDRFERVEWKNNFDAEMTKINLNGEHKAVDKLQNERD